MSSIGLSFGENPADERPRSLTSAVQERLRADILSTRLLPGQKLHIAGLAKQFSVSLAAVREALSRLVADGLVQASDQRGFRVSPVSPADLRDVTQTRVDIEGLALRRSIERGDAAWLASVEKSFAALCAVPHTYPDDPTHHYEEWVVRHRVFHRTLVNACGSQWLLDFRDVLHEQSERYRRLAIRRNTEKSRNVEAEHARHRGRHAQARCRCRGRGPLHTLPDDHASRRDSQLPTLPGVQHHLIDRSKTKSNRKAKGKRHHEHHPTPHISSGVFDLTLTFDNGPEPGVTPRVLDILRERGIKATFFVIGEKLGDPERHRLAARAHDEGHWIGNHTFTHTVPLGQQHDPDAAQHEIGRTQEAIGDLAHPQRWFRPFGGGGNLDDRLLKPSVVDYLTRNKHSCVLWNAIPRDWDDPDGWAERALEQCRSQPWSLMVLHDLPSGAMNHLECFIDRAGKAGARFHQDFPPDCVPIRSGEIVRSIEPYVSSIEEGTE